MKTIAELGSRPLLRARVFVLGQTIDGGYHVQLAFVCSARRQRPSATVSVSVSDASRPCMSSF